MAHLLILLLFIMAGPFPAHAGTGIVRVVGINGPVTPVIADYLGRNLHESARSNERLVIIEMDTPGGLDNAMRDIVKDILASPVPVVVHVAPAGARAASAGAVIALAADICAMAPGTNIGAAHPVSIGEKPDKVMAEKLVNDAEAYVEGIAQKRGRDLLIAKKMVRESLSVTAEKALDGKVIDLIAADRGELLKKLDGRTVARDGKTITLQLAGVEVTEHGMRGRERILNVISNPNVAYVLLMLGFLGLFFELSNPGVILPGVIGGISLILAFFCLPDTAGQLCRSTSDPSGHHSLHCRDKDRLPRDVDGRGGGLHDIRFAPAVRIPGTLPARVVERDPGNGAGNDRICGVGCDPNHKGSPEKARNRT